MRVDLEEGLPFGDGSFDCVFTKSVVEHLGDPVFTLTEALRVLRPGGAIAVMTPSWRHTWNEIFYSEYTHVRPFTKQSLEEVLTLAGFEAASARYFWQLPVLWRLPLLRPLTVIPRLAQIPYRPLHAAPWPAPLNRAIRFSREVMLLGLARAAALMPRRERIRRAAAAGALTASSHVETASRAVEASMARRAAPAVLRVGRRSRRLGPVIGAFERDAGDLAELLSAYRGAVKSTWPSNWWAADALLALRRRVSLSVEAERLADSIESGRTLPVPVAEVAAVVAGLKGAHPDELLPTGRQDETLDMELLEVAPREEDLRARATGYRAVAAQLCATATRNGLDLSRARILDAGTGSGYLAFALAGLAAEVVGVHLAPDEYVMPAERERMRTLLAGEFAGHVRLERGDVHALDFPDGHFDLVCSMTAVEHFADLERSVSELARVLPSGGLMVHGVEPWFSKRGGHGLCTLDFPWGHVRLQPEEPGATYTSSARTRPIPRSPTTAVDSSSLRRPRGSHGRRSHGTSRSSNGMRSRCAHSTSTGRWQQPSFSPTAGRASRPSRGVIC